LASAVTFLFATACEREGEFSVPTATVELAAGQVINVGPTRTYKTLTDVQSVVVPGDVVLVDYGTYATAARFQVDATATSPITIRGCLPGMSGCISDASGKRPLIKAGVNVTGQIFMMHFQGNHYVFENFEFDLAKDEGNPYFSDATRRSAATPQPSDTKPMP
jgi:hypothetical protein